MVVKKQNRYIHSQSKEQNVETGARAKTEKSCMLLLHSRSQTRSFCEL